MPNSRRKGSKNERQLTKLFEEWTGHKFSRTPSSGGLHWKNTQTSGDIICTDDGYFFPFSIEAKNYREINFEHLLYLKEPKIIEFWEQCKRDAEEAPRKKIPLLFMRYNGMPRDLHFVVFDPAPLLHILKDIWHPHPYLDFGSISHRIMICKSDNFFSSPYLKIRKALKASELWPKRK